MEASSLTHLIAPIILIFMMLGMGMSLVKDDFKPILLEPKAVLVGSFMQMVMLPLIGLFIAYIFPVSPEIAVGIIVLASCPGGPGSNLVAYICRGDAALSVTLTAVSSLLTAITIPLFVMLAFDIFMKTSPATFAVWDTSIKIFLITVPPIIIGMTIKYYAPNFAAKSEVPVKVGAILFLLAVIIGVFIKERNNLENLLSQAGIPAVTLCFLTVSLGFVSAKLFKLNQEQGKTIAIEVGLQNAALAIIVATTFLGNTQMAIPAAVYSPVMLTMSGLFIIHALVSGKRNKQSLPIGNV